MGEPAWSTTLNKEVSQGTKMTTRVNNENKRFIHNQQFHKTLEGTFTTTKKKLQLTERTDDK